MILCGRSETTFSLCFWGHIITFVWFPSDFHSFENFSKRRPWVRLLKLKSLRNYKVGFALFCFQKTFAIVVFWEHVGQCNNLSSQASVTSPWKGGPWGAVAPRMVTPGPSFLFIHIFCRYLEINFLLQHRDCWV